MFVYLFQEPEPDQAENQVPDPADFRRRDPALGARVAEHQEGVVDDQSRQETDEKTPRIVGTVEPDRQGNPDPGEEETGESRRERTF